MEACILTCSKVFQTSRDAACNIEQAREDESNTSEGIDTKYPCSSCSYPRYSLFLIRHYSWRVLLRLHCYADPRRVAGSAVWWDPRIWDLSRDRLDSYHADTDSSTDERRRSDYSQGDRGAGFGK